MSVNIRFDGYVSLEDHEAWPDGVPEQPTAEAFAVMMERDGPKLHTLSDYCLAPDLEVYVSIDNGPEVEVWPRRGRPAPTGVQEGSTTEGAD